MAVLSVCGTYACGSDDETGGRFTNGTPTHAGAAGQGGDFGNGGRADGGAGGNRPGSGGSTGGGGNGGGGGSAGGQPICDNDSAEPNNTESKAHPVGTFGDCDLVDPFKIKGMLAEGDTDWFRYDGTDGACAVDPTVAFTASGQIQICQYIDCAAPTVTCPANSKDATSTSGLLGCCSNKGFSVDFVCDTLISDDATVYLRINKPNAQACVTYDIDLHF